MPPSHLFMLPPQTPQPAGRIVEGSKRLQSKKSMCIAAWIWQAHPIYQLLLVHNRDEYHDRPSIPVEWWGAGNQQILGGRDGLAGGTWLGCTKTGRFAFLTNVREVDPVPTATTRGDLPVRFLEGDKSPLEFADEVAKEAENYNGFNLILADVYSHTMAYVTNRPKGGPAIVERISPGLHVLSNARLDSSWPKAQRLSQSFKDLLCKYGEKEVPAEEIVQQLMRDTAKANSDSLPRTGCNPELEMLLSSIFVQAERKQGLYGTRSTTVVSVKANGEVNFFEENLEMGEWKQRNVQYQMRTKTSMRDNTMKDVH